MNTWMVLYHTGKGRESGFKMYLTLSSCFKEAGDIHVVTSMCFSNNLTYKWDDCPSSVINLAISEGDFA